MAEAPRLQSRVPPLLQELRALSRAQLKGLMGLSDGLAQLNHERYLNFDQQPQRIAIGAFEGQVDGRCSSM